MLESDSTIGFNCRLITQSRVNNNLHAREMFLLFRKFFMYFESARKGYPFKADSRFTIQWRSVRIIDRSSMRQRSMSGRCDVTVPLVYIGGVNRVSLTVRNLLVFPKIRNLNQIGRKTFPRQLTASPLPLVPPARPANGPKDFFLL